MARHHLSFINDIKNINVLNDLLKLEETQDYTSKVFLTYLFPLSFLKRETKKVE